MIVDRIERFQQYTRSVPDIYEVMKFAEKVKKENIPVGKYPIQNGFVLVQEGQTRKFEEADFEVHRKYLDIQILVSGTEYVEYADIKDLTTKVAFDEEKDLELMDGAGCKIQIKPDMFYVLYPSDGHKPCCHEEISTNYKKVLAKIKIDKLIHRVDFPVAGL